MRNEPTNEDGSTESTHDGGDARTGRLSRRRLVAAGASTWLTIGVAGCTGDSNDDGGDDGGDDETTSTTVTNRTTQTSPTTTSSPTDGETEAPTPTPTETTTSSGGSGTTTTCPSESLFPVGSPVGFLVGIFETDSGEIIGPGDLEEVSVRFPNADVPPQELSWDGPHADHIENQWGGKLPSTDDLAPGDYSYDVVVDAGSDEEVVQTGQFTLVDVDG
ncbi:MULTISPECIES: hypothetical protein [Haloferax]|uniref:Uncharacterized protein n=1 Tax=Haloferax marinum TaxID=2666143 RepID=A0A6A8G4T9_9EURY|nr:MULTISPECIES: hypothetical protein [Haloferax]MRW95999.1 hypothetical protein [Haloferax marinum]